MDDAVVAAGKQGPATRVIRRLGIPPQQRGSMTNCSCPDIFELADGRFAVIGTDITDELEDLPGDASRGRDERIVAITRETLTAAKADIPNR